MKFQTPEGATPIEDASDLIPQGLLTYQNLCTAEAENILEALRHHLSRRKSPKCAWFTEEFLRKVHRDMFGKVWRWAGTYRSEELNIGVASHQIREEIAKLCADVAFWSGERSTIPAMERAARIHHRLTWIHPFKNGNGRHARLVADIFLNAHRCARPDWHESDLSAAGDIRSQYLQAIRAADKGDFKPLIELTTRRPRT